MSNPYSIPEDTLDLLYCYNKPDLEQANCAEESLKQHLSHHNIETGCINPISDDALKLLCCYYEQDIDYCIDKWEEDFYSKSTEQNGDQKMGCRTYDRLKERYLLYIVSIITHTQTRKRSACSNGNNTYSIILLQ